jgi:hypothetical protein
VIFGIVTSPIVFGRPGVSLRSDASTVKTAGGPEKANSALNTRVDGRPRGTKYDISGINLNILVSVREIIFVNK